MKGSLGLVVGFFLAIVCVGAARSQDPDPLTTKCLVVSDLGITKRLFGTKSPESVLSKTGGKTTEPECKELGGSTGPLTGTGDLIMGVDWGEFAKAQETHTSQAGEFVLSLNGVPLPHDAELIAVEHIGTLAVLRFRVRQGDEIQRLWSMLYADRGLFQPQLLYAALGWMPGGTSTPAATPWRSSKVSVLVSITTVSQLVVALSFVLFAVVIVVYLGRRTDALRDAGDADMPSWWAEAKVLQAELAGLASDQERDIKLGEKYPGVYVSAQRSLYAYFARSALDGVTIRETDIPAVRFGLALRTDHWKPLRASYSLSRTQLALWFTFTVATGLFLWLLYGDLRRIDGSVLALLGISVGAAGVGWASDHSMDSKPYSPSRGFWTDLITGFDERKQLHRYQAVVVNLMLLVVGIYHVIEQLSYPVFDPTWLIFLGISGAAYGLGKQALETK